MMANPLENPLFRPVAVWVGTTFAVLTLIVLVRDAQRRRRSECRRLLAPVLTAAALAGCLVIALFAGGVPLVTLTGLLGVVCLREYVVMTDLRRAVTVVLFLGLGAGLAAALTTNLTAMLAVPALVFVLGNATYVLADRTADSQRQLGAAMTGCLYVVIPLSHWVYIRETHDWGLAFLLLVLSCAWLSDVFGYLVGLMLGGPRMVPAVSPDKTWSGALGSVTATSVAAPLLGTMLSLPANAAKLAVIGFAASLCAIFGDLVESVIKRDRGVKDAGTALPGFGGFLDRFDSMLLTVPLVYHGVSALHVFAR